MLVGESAAYLTLIEEIIKATLYDDQREGYGVPVYRHLSHVLLPPAKAYKQRDS